MEDNRNKFFNQRGVTLVELLVIVLIIIVVSTIALVSFGSSKKQLSRQNVARELKVAFERARFDSVKRRAQVGNHANVVVTANSFTLKTDIDQDGTIEPGEERVNSSWNSDISILSQDGSASTPTTTVEFNKRGETVTTGTAVFLVCNGVCSTPTSSNSNLVLVTATGTVNILPGGATAPTFVAPGVTNVNSSSGIRSETTVNANGS